MVYGITLLAILLVILPYRLERACRDTTPPKLENGQEHWKMFSGLSAQEYGWNY
jgi:hypothetical protein